MQQLPEKRRLEMTLTTTASVNHLLNTYRRARVWINQLRGLEPRVPVQCDIALEMHGNEYCGWSIPAESLAGDSVVVDVGLGEDITFSTSLIDKYGCTVHGFDPTPRAIAYVEQLGYRNFVLHRFGVADKSARATFYLPNNASNVSGSLARADHTGRNQIDVQLITLDEVRQRVGGRIDVLKLDIEGAEYDLLQDDRFARHAPQIKIVCIEFHHRWPNFGRAVTERAVARLNALGFTCCWARTSSNEEFTFINSNAMQGIKHA